MKKLKNSVQILPRLNKNTPKQLRKKALLEQKKAFLLNHILYAYAPHIKQKEFHHSLHKERAFLAGNRCGKTYCGAMEMAMHLTGRYPTWWRGKRFETPIRAWAASVTTEATRDILQYAYLGNIKEGLGGTIPPETILKKTLKRGVSDAVDTVFICHASGGVSQLSFKSYDQGREKFQGTSKHVIHLDEEPDLRLYEECLLRTLDCGGMLMLTMTPLKGMSDVCLHFLEHVSPDKKAIHASWADAIHLSVDDVAQLKKTLRPHEIEAREKGIPSLGAGRVFPVTEKDISVKRFDIPPHFKRVFGMDFGWTNPTAVVWLAYDAENDSVYVTDIYLQSERTPQEHVKAIRAKGDWINGVADPAGQGANQADGRSLMAHYAEHGLYLTPADNHVDSGLMHLLERMQSGRFKVFDDLHAWWAEFRLYRRNERGQVVKTKDHLMDATRYAVMSGLSLAGTQPAKEQYLRRNTDWRCV